MTIEHGFRSAEGREAAFVTSGAEDGNGAGVVHDNIDAQSVRKETGKHERCCK